MKKLRLTPAMIAGGGVISSLVIAAFVVMLVSITDQRDSSERVAGADQRIALANELERRIIDVETGQRGFVITGERSFLQPRSDALRALPSLKSDLMRRERAEGAPEQVMQLRLIYAKLGNYVRGYSRPLIAAGRRDLGSARAVVETGQGKRRIDALRAAIEVFVAQESATARARSDDADRSASIAVGLAIAGLFLVPLLVIALVTFISRTVADPVRETSNAAQRMRAGDLTVRVKERGIGEARALAAAFNDMAESLQSNRDELKTQNDQLESALERSDRAAALNQSILESAQDAYVAVDDDGVVLAWNRTAEELYGIPATEAMGQRVAELVLPGDPEAQQRHDERRRGILEAADETGSIERYKVWARRGDGSPVHVEVSAAAVRSSGGAVVTYFSRDITEHTLREQESAADDAVSRALAEQGGGEEALGSILAAMGDNLDWPVGGFWEYDEHEHEVRCSRIWIASGFEFPELAEFSRQIVYVPGEELPDFPVLKQAWDSQRPVWEVLESEQLSERQQTARSTGLRAGVALPVMSGGRMLGLLTFGARATAEPDAHRWLRLRSITNLIGQVMERTTARQEADRLKNEFFALVSHELRTPLTSITGYLEIVRAGDAGEITEDQRHYLNVIDRNARRLHRLVSDLLFIAQIEAGRMPANRRSMLDLEAIAAESVDAARPQADKKGVLLTLDAEPVSTAGDGERLGQLIDNLVSNALKFTSEGGTVGVRLSSDGATATIQVSDTGMGISPEDQEKLFERFYRTTDAEKLALPGLGLGLSICKAIAESHGGSISVSSTEGRGTTFTVELPVSETVTEPDVIIAKSNGHERRDALPGPPTHSA